MRSRQQRLETPRVAVPLQAAITSGGPTASTRPWWPTPRATRGRRAVRAAGPLDDAAAALGGCPRVWDPLEGCIVSA